LCPSVTSTWVTAILQKGLLAKSLFVTVFLALLKKRSAEVRIVTYRELHQKSDLLPLMEQAFGWPFEPSARARPRLRDGCVGFCALDEARVVGYVGVMDLATKTVGGAVEKAGGIYGVATLPSYTRRGVCRALLDRAHEYLVEKDYRFSFLTTSPTIVAYSLYLELGYSDVTSFPGAYKVKEKGERRTSGRERTKLDFDRMLEIYREYVKDKTGLVVRNEAYMKMLAKTLEIAAGECITTSRGYIIFKKEKKRVRIRELIACDEKEMNELVGRVEDKAQNLVYARAVLDPTLRRVYRSLGFSVLEAGHGVIMVKELTETPFNEAYSSRFYMGALDHF